MEIPHLLIFPQDEGLLYTMKETRDLLHRILEDANVVDLDFSRWYDAISIYFVADHLPLVNKQRPLYCVQFEQVLSFSFEVLHREQMPRHPVWQVCGGEIRTAKNMWRVSFSHDSLAPTVSPAVSITCKNVAISRKSWSLFAQVGNIGSPYGSTMGLRRPGVEVLARLLRSRKGKRQS